MTRDLPLDQVAHVVIVGVRNREVRYSTPYLLIGLYRYD